MRGVRVFKCLCWEGTCSVAAAWSMLAGTDVAHSAGAVASSRQPCHAAALCTPGTQRRRTHQSPRSVCSAWRAWASFPRSVAAGRFVWGAGARVAACIDTHGPATLRTARQPQQALRQRRSHPSSPKLPCVSMHNLSRTRLVPKAVPAVCVAEACGGPTAGTVEPAPASPTRLVGVSGTQITHSSIITAGHRILQTQ